MKALFFDIDGTLIDNNKGINEIPETVVKEIERIQANGDKVFIASGRPKAMLNDAINRIKWDGYVLMNGGHIEVEGKTIYENKMDYNLAKATCDMLEKFNCDYMIETADGIYIKPEYKELYDFFVKLGMEEMFSMDFDRDEVLKRTIKVEANVTKEHKEELENFIMNDFGYVINNDEHGSDHSFEFYPTTLSKALGIERVINYFQIPKKQTWAFGDGENDIEMLEFVKHSVAMGNSSAEVMSAADITTGTIENDGLAMALKALIQ